MDSAPPAGLPDAPENLVRLAAQGDDGAFSRIVRLHRDDMFRVAFVVGGGRALAEEATAAAWPVVWRRLGRFRSPDRLRPWLCAIAADEARQLIRRRRRRIASAREIARAEHSTDLAEEPATDRALIVAMGGLEPDDRSLLAVRCLAGGDMPELARAAGLSSSGARSRLDPLLARMARELGDAEPGAPRSALDFEHRLQAYAAIPVPPVDAVAATREARAALSAERNHLVSVVVALLVAALVMATFYAITLEGEGGAPAASPSPTAVRTPPGTLPAGGASVSERGLAAAEAGRFAVAATIHRELLLERPSTRRDSTPAPRIGSIRKTPGGRNLWRSMSL
jgi:RNA polymerase sigma factor (sigma-70 family)